MPGAARVATVLLAGAGLAAGCARDERARGASSIAAPNASAAAPLEYSGSAACADCHRAQTALWRGSHHDLAMQDATAETVLGDFADASFAADGVTTTFFRRDERFWIRTPGRDGRQTELALPYTFGVDPLQQYLVALPDGRLQAFGVAWDSRPAAAGGQRWFDLYPGDRLEPGDPLHWTGRDQTWNHMCAECHSTGLRKGYQADEDRYRTTWSEIDVACEACHGPGSRHVSWARAEAGARPGAGGGDPERGLAVRLRDAVPGQWIMDLETGIAKRSPPRARDTQIEVCARCHSRRATLTESYRHGGSLLDTHAPALLDAALYFADGQIREEVFEWGSFLQSRMHRAGVTCSDCHDPHSLAVRGEGNAACAGCHLPSRFDAVEHHRHRPGTRGAACVECHMPAREYMVVDRRRDHSLRVPRPDLATALGAPDACTACHRDRDATEH